MAPPGYRFLFVTWNGGGNVLPTMGIAGKLAARGHQVRVVAPRSLAGAVRPQVRSERPAPRLSKAIRR